MPFDVETFLFQAAPPTEEPPVRATAAWRLAAAVSRSIIARIVTTARESSFYDIIFCYCMLFCGSVCVKCIQSMSHSSNNLCLLTFNSFRSELVRPLAGTQQKSDDDDT